MSKWKEHYEYYKRNPIKYYEDMLGVKFTKIQRIKLKIYSCLIDYLNDLVIEEKELLEEMGVEPYGTIRYEVLKFHLAVLELRTSIIKSILKI